MKDEWVGGTIIVIRKKRIGTNGRHKEFWIVDFRLLIVD